ncbi:hypothetical protein L7F22_034834 [Adiantum nelumboides]|nr:hypothetical protein [Adiantum nelumboides]
MVAMQALRRDVLQWLVSLNLSFPIKNIKRDFSNGFLVAEILSRYFPQDVQMHSFDYGLKLAKKKDNWDQLRKIFWAKDFPFFQDEIENIINCGPHDGAGPFLERLYGFLTHRRYKPEDCDVDELWPGVTDSSSLLTSKSLPLSNEGSNLPKKLETHNALLVAEHIKKDMPPGIDSEAIPTEREDEQSLLVEMDIPREEVGPDINEMRWVSSECGTEKTQPLIAAEKMRKISANAVERARQKYRRSQYTHVSPKARALTEIQESACNVSMRDVSLAFRSPNRQRKFKTYTLEDYKKQQTGIYIELGKLGPDTTTESLLNQKQLRYRLVMAEEAVYKCRKQVDLSSMDAANIIKECLSEDFADARNTLEGQNPETEVVIPVQQLMDPVAQYALNAVILFFPSKMPSA